MTARLMAGQFEGLLAFHRSLAPAYGGISCVLQRPRTVAVWRHLGVPDQPQILGVRDTCGLPEVVKVVVGPVLITGERRDQKSEDRPNEVGPKSEVRGRDGLSRLFAPLHSY